MLLLHLVPIWVFRFLPTQDGPSHVNNANIIYQMLSDGPDIFHQYFVLNPTPDPNLLGHAVLSALIHFFPPQIAEKILVSIYVVLFAASFRYALHAVAGRPSYLSLSAFPFVFSYSFHMGFYNFSISIAFYFLAVAFWLRTRHRSGAGVWIAFSILLLVLAASHVLTALLTWITLGCMLGAAAMERACTSATTHKSIRTLVSTFRESAAPLALASLPALALTGTFLFRQSSAGVTPAPLSEVAVRFGRLFTLEGIVSFHRLEVVFSTTMFLAILAGIAYVFRSRRREGWHPSANDGFLLLAGIFACIYVLAPNEAAGGSSIRVRLNPFVSYCLLLWLAAQQPITRLHRPIRAIGCTLAVGFLLVHSASYSRINTLLEEYVYAGTFVAPESVLLPLSFDHWGTTDRGDRVAWRIQPFRHAAGYIAAERNVVTLDNYEANVGYFPVLFRPSLNPYDVIGQLESPGNHFIDFGRYTGAVPGGVDYVLVWGNPRVRLSGNPHVTFVYHQLERNYDLIYRSSHGTGVELYGSRALFGESM